MGLLYSVLRSIIKSSRKAAKARARHTAPEKKGKMGEKALLNNLQRIKCYKKFVPNLHIHYNNNQYTEIDLVMVTEYGIFVYEMKNYNGSIYGNATSQNWKEYLGGQEFSFYNPILQNKGHVYALHKATKLYKSVFYSIIVFGSEATLKIYNVDNKECKVTNLQNAAKLTNTLIVNREPIFTQTQVDGIYNLLINTKIRNDEALGKA